MSSRAWMSELSLVQAINHLSSIADLSQETIQRTLKEDPEHLEHVYPWLDMSSEEATLSNIKLTFSVVLDYFKNLYSKDKERLTESEIQRGLRSLMSIAEQAVIKLDQNLSFLKHHAELKSISYLPEYQELIDFYQKKLMRKLEKENASEEFWHDDWKEALASDSLDTETEGISDLADIRDDRHYELFFIKQENGRQYFSKELLRSIHLVHDFDPIVLSELSDEVFQDINKVASFDATHSAQAIKKSVMDKLHYFFKRRDHFQSSELYGYLSYSLYALFLASTPHMHDAIKGTKSSLKYFSDFAKFLQQAFMSNDFVHFSQSSLQDIDSYIEELMQVVYKLCMKLFLRVESKDQMIGFIYKLMDKPTFPRKKIEERNPLHLWKTLEEEYALLTKIMQRYPSGPLSKTLEYLKNPQDDETYDFIMMDNMPSRLYDVQMGDMKSVMMRLASPTKQTEIQKAQDLHLFKMLLKSLSMDNPKMKFLLVNLQDRTSWQEYARCECLESLPAASGDYAHLIVCTLARNTSFYHQTEEYFELSSAKDFIKAFKEQFKDEKACGYYFPKSFNKLDMHRFGHEVIDTVYEEIFLKKDTLTHKNRQDFIEIVHYMLVLKMQEGLQPDYLSLSCKDAIDSGPGFYAGYFAFIKLLSQDPIFSVEDEDFIVYMMHAPALFKRDRLINRKHFQRALSALSTLSAELDVKRAKILKAFSALFQKDFFKYLSVWEAKN